MSCLTCLAVGVWHSVFTQSLPAVAGCRSSAVWVLRWNVSVRSLVTWRKSGTALWPWHPCGWRTPFGWISLWGSCCPAQQGDVYNYLSSGPKDLLSDRCVLSCPSMDLVTCLLDFRLNLASHRSIIPRLAASLAACAQLSALGEWVAPLLPGLSFSLRRMVILRLFCLLISAASHRMWALQRLRKLLTTEFGQSININRLLGDNDGETRALVWNITL